MSNLLLMTGVEVYRIDSTVIFEIITSNKFEKFYIFCCIITKTVDELFVQKGLENIEIHLSAILPKRVETSFSNNL